MNPKHAPAMATITEIPERTHENRVRSGDIVNVLKSIKQMEQLKSYIADLESKVAQTTKSSI